MSNAFTLDDFVRLNPTADRVQYVHHLVNHTGWGKDAVQSVLETFYPVLILKDGMVLVESIGAVARYDGLRASGRDALEAQGWANVLPISEIYGHGGHKSCLDIAHVIRQGWLSAARRQLPNHAVSVEVSTEFDAGETVVVMRNA